MKSVNKNKNISKFLMIVLCVSLLSTSAFAATEYSLGTRTVHEDPVYCSLQGSVYYNSYTTSALDIYAMHTRVWNYGCEISDSYFYAGNATKVDRTDDFLCIFWGLSGGAIPTGASNRVWIADWEAVTDCYDHDTVYSYSSTECCLTQVGIMVEAYSGIYYYYYYSTYWLPTLTRTTETYGF